MDEETPSLVESLTERELEILALMAEDKTDAEVYGESGSFRIHGSAGPSGKFRAEAGEWRNSWTSGSAEPRRVSGSPCRSTRPPERKAQ